MEKYDWEKETRLTKIVGKLLEVFLFCQLISDLSKENSFKGKAKIILKIIRNILIILVLSPLYLIYGICCLWCYAQVYDVTSQISKGILALIILILDVLLVIKILEYR